MALDLPLPYRNVTIKTNLSKEEVFHRLDRIVSRKYIWRRKKREDKEFYGKMEDDKFRIARFIEGRNSYLPRITGSIERGADGTYLNLKMALHPLVILAMFFFLIQPLYISYSKTGTINLIWPAAVIVFHVVMYYVGFLPEARKTEERFNKLLA